MDQSQPHSPALEADACAMHEPRRLGVSVVICTYNGAARLPATLAHLAAQKGGDGLEWEVIVVDNASTDDTAEVARRCWPPDAPALLRIVHEPRSGLANARVRGFAEARHEIVSFVDDDTWVADDWISIVSEVMSKSPGLGALGSLAYPACEIQAPPWFERFKINYAILTDDNLSVIGEPPVALFGAGLSVRRTAWRQLVRDNFSFGGLGMTGSKLGGGEDNELTCSLREAGWELRVDPRLRIEHFLPSNRLNWPYLRRLVRQRIASSVFLDAYGPPSERPAGLKARARATWTWQVLVAVKQLLQRPRALVLAPFCMMEGDPLVLEYESWVGRLKGLIQMRREYAATRHRLAQRKWNRRDSN